MDSDYLDVDTKRELKPLGDVSARFSKVSSKKKRGGLNEITLLRSETAKMLKVPIGQVYGLTRGWTKNEIRDTLKICTDFVNPPALFWKLYKENNQKYGRKQSNKRTLLKNRKKGRKEDCGKRNAILF